MREAWVIAKREFLERVRNKWFLIMTIIGPIALVAMIVVPALVGRGTKGAKVEIVDKTGRLAAQVIAELGTGEDAWLVTEVASDTPEQALRDRIRSKAINGFLVIPSDVFTGGNPVYQGDNASNQTVRPRLTKVLYERVSIERGRIENISEDKLNKILAGVTVQTLHTNGEAAGASGELTFLIGYIVALILYFAITLYGINVMRSVVTDKSSRVVELLVASVKPRALMTGKIVGVGGAGFVQLAIWFVIAGVALSNRDTILGWLGATNSTSLPSLGWGEIAVAIAFFIAGYIFYSTMYAAVGAMVSSDQEAQQAQFPITMMLIIAMVCMQMITGDPRGGTAAALTLVPFWSPMLMPLRYFLGGATLFDVALSLVLLALSTYVVARLAAKIYRVGILLYGKRPNLRELVRWLRY